MAAADRTNRVNVATMSYRDRPTSFDERIDLAFGCLCAAIVVAMFVGVVAAAAAAVVAVLT